MSERRLTRPGAARRAELERAVAALSKRIDKVMNRVEDSRTRIQRLEKSVAELQDGMTRIEELLVKGTGTKPGVVPGVADVRAGVEALTRLAVLSPDQLEYPQRLTSRRFGITSQSGEDGVIWAIFEEAGATDHRFVELGCGDNGGNSGFLAGELGWTGLMLDGSASNAEAMRRLLGGRGVTVLEEWLTRENVNDLLRDNGFEGEVDLFSLDIDGNDYWVWEALSAISPRLVVVEYNTSFGSERAVTVPYDASFQRDKDRASGLYYGASLAAMESLGRRKGYRLVATENVNAFFLRDDVAPQIPALPVPRGHRLYSKEAVRLAGLGGDLFAVLEGDGLELVEVADGAD